MDNTPSLDQVITIVAMGKKGLPTAEIAKTCNMEQGEIEVILGIARIVGGKAEEVVEHLKPTRKS